MHIFRLCVYVTCLKWVPHCFKAENIGWAQIEHNLAAAARLYDNIYLTELGTLLGVDGDKAEAIASKMIIEGRLKVHIPSPPPGVLYTLCLV